MRIHEILIYTDFKHDESYTPSKISIRAGTTFHDLQEIHVEELNEPSGWVKILPPREAATDEAAGSTSSTNSDVLRTHFIQVAILANHQNGRDTHIRQIKIFTPRRHMGQHMALPEFSTINFQQYACVR
jgi:anaphase-promoting complex subunit 10